LLPSERAPRSGEASSATVCSLSDLFAGRQAVRHHAEGEQDRLDDDGDDQHAKSVEMRKRLSTESAAACDEFHIISMHDSARAHQPTRPPGVVPARGAVVVGLPLAGRPLQILI
jgi:hypothetical protein